MNKEYNLGDLVWIPAGAELVISSVIDNPPSGYHKRSVCKKTPVYGLVLESGPSMIKVLVEQELFYVQYRHVYGEKNDY